VGVVYKKTGGCYNRSHGWSPLELYPIYAAAHPNMPANHPLSKPAGRKRHFQVSNAKNRTDTNAVVVGDEVRLVESGAHAGVIVAILPRRNKIARRSAVPMPGAHPFEQVIAANMDQVVPVFSAAEPPPKWNLLDRYLVSAESAGIPALACITKLDLAPQDPHDGFWQELENYREIGYPVLAVSALTGAGLEDLRRNWPGDSQSCWVNRA